MAPRAATEDDPVDGPASPAVASALEALIARHDARLRRLAAAMLVDRGSVDDVLQNAYLRAYTRGPERFDGPAHEAAWLHRVVYRCCVDELRRSRRHRRREVPVEQAETERTLRSVEQTPADDIWRGLSDRDRAVLLLIDIAQLDYGTAARLLRVPRGTVASRLNAARAKLRRRIEDERRG